MGRIFPGEAITVQGKRRWLRRRERSLSEKPLFGMMRGMIQQFRNWSRQVHPFREELGKTAGKGLGKMSGEKWS
ncbi:hypothetical protein CPA56_00275 [Bombella sp. TMW2.1889]|uniref:Uncharacterized protein n=1 Tax=Bombella mellum TaxID=2039288 RepID=A0ABR5ZQB6_9PROT|nr:hypothetical protein [Bombella mellum]